MLSEKDFARFAAKVAMPTEPDGCMEWTAAKTGKGYGTFRRGSTFRRAHRVAFEHWNGPIPEDTPVVRHKCDKPSCVRPDHLELGTVADNNRDMVERGRTGSFAANQAARAHCPREHGLTPASLVPSQLARGMRKCLACTCARTARYDARRRHGIEWTDAEFRADADRRYREITAAEVELERAA